LTSGSSGALAIIEVEKIRLRRYLLGQLSEDGEEQVEVRLMNDPDYANEFDILVDELTEQYASGALPAEDRELMERHFFISEARRDKLRFMLALIEAAAQGSVPKGRLPSRSLKYAAIAAALLIVILGAWIFLRPSEIDKGLLALKSAYREQRPTEARISALNYAPFSPTRGPGSERIDENDLRRAELTLLTAVKNKPSPEAHYAIGEFYLTQRRFDDAIGQFNEALKARPRDAALLSDLGAAFLERGKLEASDQGQGKSFEDFGQSLQHLNQALDLNGQLASALFNRALCKEMMKLRDSAIDDWRRYLQIDPNSQWSDEAREHLKRLEDENESTRLTKEDLYNRFLEAFRTGSIDKASQMVALSSCRAGNCLVELLSDDYLTTAASDHERDQATRALAALSLAGRLRLETFRDAYAHDLAACYARSSPAVVQIIIQARGLATVGQQEIARAQFAQAVESYTKAASLFEKSEDKPEAMQSKYWLAICFQQLNENDRSISLLQEVVNSAETSGYYWLVVRALNGLNNHYANDFRKSLELSTKSLLLAGKSGDLYGQISAFSQVIGIYNRFGNYDSSLSVVQQALSMTDSLPLEPKQTWLEFSTIASTCYSLKLYEAAIEYQRSAIASSADLHDPSIQSMSYTYLGMVFRGAGQYELALASLQKALSISAPSASEAFGKKLTAFTLLEVGRFYSASGDYQRALQAFDESAALYTTLKFPVFLFECHKGKLIAAIKSNNNQTAETELRLADEIYEQHRTEIADQADRNMFANNEQDLYDVAIDFEFSKMGDAVAAFEYSENNRSRGLLEGLSFKNDQANNAGQQVAYLNLQEIRRRMPENAQILQFAVLENKLYTWVVSTSEFESSEQEIEADRLGALVRDYLQIIQSQDPTRLDEQRRQASDLYNILILPSLRYLDPQKVVYFVPDGPLSLLPFASLFSPSSGRYLVEDFALGIAPSSSIFVACSERARKINSEERLLSVGNPGFDRTAFPDLADLPGARREAEAITAYYDKAMLLVQHRATKASVMREIPKATIVHLATHSIQDQVNPRRWEILLASAGRSASDSSSLSAETIDAQDIDSLNLSQTKIVVLSSCQTASGPSLRGEGPITLARSFIGVGVPEVIASLWSVDSNATADLMTAFHRYRRMGNLSTVEALRHAQLEMVRGPFPNRQLPYYWASFNLIGGLEKLQSKEKRNEISKT
jgi:CHAT domain-containing protein/Tfp pilus assembly protein PilF